MAGTSVPLKSEPQVAVPVHLGQKPKRGTRKCSSSLSEPVPLIHAGRECESVDLRTKPIFPVKRRTRRRRRPRHNRGWAEENLPVLERLEAEFRETAKSAVESLEGVYPGTTESPGSNMSKAPNSSAKTTTSARRRHGSFCPGNQSGRNVPPQRGRFRTRSRNPRKRRYPRSWLEPPAEQAIPLDFGLGGNSRRRGDTGPVRSYGYGAVRSRRRGRGVRGDPDAGGPRPRDCDADRTRDHRRAGQGLPAGQAVGRQACARAQARHARRSARATCTLQHVRTHGVSTPVARTAR